VYLIHNKASFYSEELLASRPTPKLEDRPLLAVHKCLFNIFVATLHIGGHSSIHNLSMHLTMVTGTHLSWAIFYASYKKGKTVLQMFYEIFNLLVTINVAWLAMRHAFGQNYLYVAQS
jgi:hypothetical protein